MAHLTTIAQNDGGPVIEESIRQLLKDIGEDPHREGLLKTPERVARTWQEMTAGYGVDPESLIASATFENDYEGLVIVKAIPFTSICEHHLFLFHGTATVGYLPRKRVVGLSKLARLVDCFAKRLQIQERMTQEIAVALHCSKALDPLAVGVIITATHTCMTDRGVRKAGDTVTSCMLGELMKDGMLRSEFMELAR